MSRVKKLTLAVVGVFFILAFLLSINANAEEPIGHTEHGIPVYAEDLVEDNDVEPIVSKQGDVLGVVINKKAEQKQLKLNVVRKIDVGLSRTRIKDVDVINRNTIIIELRNKKRYQIEFTFCDITDGDVFQFFTFNSTSLRVGDHARIYRWYENPRFNIPRSRWDTWNWFNRTCYIKTINEIVEEEKNGKEK